MTKPHKAELNDVVEVTEPRYFTIIDKRDTLYIGVETDGLGRYPRGNPISMRSSRFTPTGKTSITPGRVYRKAQKLGDRACTCLCCPHNHSQLDWMTDL